MFVMKFRQSIQLCFRLAPVVAGAPILDELPYRRKLNALRLVVNGFTIGPARRHDTSPQLDQLGFGNVYLKFADGGRAAGCRLLHLGH